MQHTCTLFETLTWCACTARACNAHWPGGASRPAAHRRVAHRHKGPLAVLPHGGQHAGDLGVEQQRHRLAAVLRHGGLCTPSTSLECVSFHSIRPSASDAAAMVLFLHLGASRAVPPAGVLSSITPWHVRCPSVTQMPCAANISRACREIRRCSAEPGNSDREPWGSFEVDHSMAPAKTAMP